MIKLKVQFIHYLIFVIVLYFIINFQMIQLHFLNFKLHFKFRQQSIIIISQFLFLFHLLLIKVNMFILKMLTKLLHYLLHVFPFCLKLIKTYLSIKILILKMLATLLHCQLHVFVILLFIPKHYQIMTMKLSLFLHYQFNVFIIF